MLSAIELDNKLRVEANEVDDVPADGLLTFELPAEQSVHPQPAPEEAFGVSRIGT
jgi:hypothetical protein